MTVEELQAARRDRTDRQSGDHGGGAGQGQGVLHLHVGHHRHAEGQRDDPLPLAAALAGFGGLGMRLSSNDTLYCCLPLYHNNALTVALSSVLNSGATLALGKSFSASKFWDEVIRYDATAFVYIGEICAYLLNQPPKDTDRKHKVRVICGNGLRPAIWDEFTERFGIERVCEFYGASEGNTAFVNVLNVAEVHRDLPDAGGVRRVRRRQPANPCATTTAASARCATASRACCCPRSATSAVRRLHRQEGHREEVGARRLQGGRRLVQHR